jgi:competence protein ComEC
MYHIPTALARSAGAALAAVVRDPAGVVAAAFAAERARAFLAAPVLIGAGITAYFLVPFEPPVWAVSAALVLSVFCLWSFRTTRLAPSSTAVCLILVGLALISLRVAVVSGPILPAQVGPAGMTGTVTRVERRPDAVRLTIRPGSFGRLKPEDLPDLVKVSVRTLDGPVSPGSRVSLLTSVRPPSSPAEPGAFDFQRHAFFQGIGGYGFAMGAVKVTAEPESGGGFRRFRDTLSSRIAGTVGEPHGGIAAALVTGDRSRLTEDQWRVLRDSGLAHLLAISGLHMGLVTGFLFFGVRAALALFPTVALRRPIKKWAALAALAGGLGYLVLTGGSVTTIRAFVMVAIVMLAVLTDRRAISLRTVAIAAILILAVTPEAIVEPGFQMSFAAVTALVAAYETYGERWRSGMGRATLFGRAARYIAGVGVTTLIAGAATGPFAIYHFGRFSDYGVLANLFAVPAVAFWVMPSATVGALLMPVGLEQPFFWLMGQGIGFVLAVGGAVADLPGAVRLVPAMPVWGLALVCIGGLWLCIMTTAWRFWGLFAVVIGLLSPYLHERPLIRVDANARLISVRTADGATMLSSARREKFTAEQWLARDAVTGSSRWPAGGASQDGRLRCDTAGCILRLESWMIALPKTQAAVAEDCRRADLVVSLEPVNGRCPSARVIIDRYDMWRNGAHAVWLDADKGPRVRSTGEDRGARPWNPAPVPGKDQYWRNSAVNRP